jgi:hypothetical protein
MGCFQEVGRWLDTIFSDLLLAMAWFDNPGQNGRAKNGQQEPAVK